MKRLIILLGVLCLVVFSGHALALTVSVSSAKGSPGDKDISVPISVSSFTAGDIMNMDLTLEYDAGRLQVGGVDTGALTGAWSKFYNPINGTGVVKICLFNLTPLPVQAGTVAVVRFSVKSAAAAGQSNLTLTKAVFKLSSADAINNGKFTVEGTGTPGPSIEPIPDREIGVGQLLSFVIVANGEGLTYSASGVPTGAVFNPATHAFSWVPQAGQEGRHSVVFTVTDVNGQQASETAVIKVTDVSGNYELHLEAETGKLTYPMKIKNYAGASGKKLIYSSKDHKGKASYTFNVPAEGDYRIWCRVKSHNKKYQKVFYVYIDGKEKYLKNKHKEAWEWLIVKTEPHGSEYHYKVHLKAGSHAMVIKGEKEDAYLDEIIITNNLKLDLDH